MKNFDKGFHHWDEHKTMEYHQVPVKQPLLPLPPPHMRAPLHHHQKNLPTTPSTFVAYPQGYYKSGIAPPPLEAYLPSDQIVAINTNDYSKQHVECYPTLVQNSAPIKMKVDSSTQVDESFPRDYYPHYNEDTGYKSGKDNYKSQDDKKPYSRKQEKHGSSNRSQGKQKNPQNDSYSSGYRNDENSKHQMNSSLSNVYDHYNDTSRTKQCRDIASSPLEQDQYSDHRKDDYARHHRNDNSSHRYDDKSKNRRDEKSPRQQNNYSDSQSNNNYRHRSTSPHRAYKYSGDRNDDNNYQSGSRSPHRKDRHSSEQRSNDKSSHRRNDSSSHRSDTYNDYRRDDKPNHERHNHSTHRSDDHSNHRNSNGRRHQSDDYSSRGSDHRNNNNDYSKQRRKDKSSTRRDKSPDRRSNESSNRRNGSHIESTIDDKYDNRNDDFRDIYDSSTGDFYTYPLDKELTSEEDQLFITTDSIGWPLESDSMSSRGSSSAGDLDCKVYVGQIGRGAVKEELEDKFGRYGRIKSVWIARNPPGFAFVVFYNIKDAELAADEMDGEIINHRRARVEMSSGKSRWGSAGPPSRRRDSRDSRDSRDRGRQHMYNGGLSRSRSRSPPRYDRYRKYSRSRSRSKSPFENIYRDRR